jgi:hypothetical protein
MLRWAENATWIGYLLYEYSILIRKPNRILWVELFGRFSLNEYLKNSVSESVLYLPGTRKSAVSGFFQYDNVILVPILRQIFPRGAWVQHFMQGLFRLLMKQIKPLCKHKKFLYRMTQNHINDLLTHTFGNIYVNLYFVRRVSLHLSVPSSGTRWN